MSAVSVIIPVYGVEPYMARTSRALFNQTLEDVEYIFIDDCSPDRSIAIMLDILETEFPARKSQVRVFRMPENSGQAKVRMQGISLATGEYVIHCDSDDVVATDAYEKMYGLAKKEDADIVICDMQRGNDSGWKQFNCGSESGKEVSDILTRKVMGSLWNRLVRRPLMNDLIPPVGNMAEDTVLTLQMTCRARKIIHLKESLYSYYITPNSISSRPGLEAALARHASIYENAKVCLQFLPLCGQDSRSADMIAFKYGCRAYLEPYVHIPKYYHLWINTFPEVDKELLFTHGIPLEMKFWFVLIHLHLYHPWKVLSGKHKLTGYGSL